MTANPISFLAFLAISAPLAHPSLLQFQLRAPKLARLNRFLADSIQEIPVALDSNRPILHGRSPRPIDERSPFDD
jgi:hypothetical protein